MYSTSQQTLLRIFELLSQHKPNLCKRFVGVVGADENILHVVLVHIGVDADIAIADHQKNPEEKRVEKNLSNDCPHFDFLQTLLPGQFQRFCIGWFRFIQRLPWRH